MGLTFAVLTNEGLKISRGTLFVFFQINKVWRCIDRIRKSDIIFIAYYAGWTGVSGSLMHIQNYQFQSLYCELPND